jgi:ribosomal protein S18 acetylase RimI-like enzyme
MIIDATKHLLELFIQDKLPDSFRYFKSRNSECMKNHVVTLLYIDNYKPVAYGHLDKDDNTIWLGICVLPSHQKKGIGSQLMKQLLDKAQEKNINTIHLTVDKINTVATKIYKKFGFNIINQTETYYIMKL